MPSIREAKEEFEYAKASLVQFSNDKELGLKEKHWSDFVLHLDLVFIKAEVGCRDIRNRFEPFQGYYKKERKEDSLLSYLKNARDNVMHGLGRICPLTIIGIADGAATIVSQDENGEDFEYTTSALVLEYRLAPFIINNKEWYPPQTHKGKKLLYPNDPHEVAYLGMKYYDDFIKEIERRFIANL